MTGAKRTSNCTTTRFLPSTTSCADLRGHRGSALPWRAIGCLTTSTSRNGSSPAGYGEVLPDEHSGRGMAPWSAGRNPDTPKAFRVLQIGHHAPERNSIGQTGLEMRREVPQNRFSLMLVRPSPAHAGKDLPTGTQPHAPGVAAVYTRRVRMASRTSPGRSVPATRPGR